VQKHGCGTEVNGEQSNYFKCATIEKRIWNLKQDSDTKDDCEKDFRALRLTSTAVGPWSEISHRHGLSLPY
jgi:hypothetical protein